MDFDDYAGSVIAGISGGGMIYVLTMSAETYLPKYGLIFGGFLSILSLLVFSLIVLIVGVIYFK